MKIHIKNIKIGTVIRERMVVVTTHREAKSALPPYFTAKSALVVPAGIPVRMRDTPARRGDIWKHLKITRAARGSARRRINAR